MRKKLIVIAMLGMLMLTGCSGTKSAKNEHNIAEKDPYEAFYGTWKVSGLYTQGERISTEELIAAGINATDGLILIIRQNGKLSLFRIGESMSEEAWKANDQKDRILLSNKEIYRENDELVMLKGEDKLFFQKVSDRQDDGVIAELILEQEETVEEPEVTPEESIEEIAEPEEETVEEEVSEQTMRPEVKEAIDAYEEFIDEYIAFMEKYEESDGSDLGMLMEYMTFISDLEEYLEKMDALENDLTDAETWYFIEVMNRCNEKIYKYGN